MQAVLSAAAMLQFCLATTDISWALLQSEPLNGNLYIFHLRRWTTNSFFVWKPFVPAYGLVETGRLRQRAIEDWMFGSGLKCVFGMPQSFLERNSSLYLLLIVTKVVDHFLLTGNPHIMQNFHDALLAWFKVGRFISKPDLVFNRRHIPQDSKINTIICMKEYMKPISNFLWI